jgi:hypothetical protein
MCWGLGLTTQPCAPAALQPCATSGAWSEAPGLAPTAPPHTFPSPTHPPPPLLRDSELTEGAAPQLVQAVCPLAAALAAQPLSAAVASTVALALQAMCATGAVPMEACLPALLPLASAIRLQAASSAAWAEAATCIAKIVEGSPPRQWSAVEAGAVGALAAALTAQLDAREARPTAAACKALEAISSGSDACKAACLESVPALMVAVSGRVAASARACTAPCAAAFCICICICVPSNQPPLTPPLAPHTPPHPTPPPPFPF